MITSLPLPLRLYFIRHGETEWSLSGRHSGRADISLTAHGEDEARAVGRRLRDIPFAHVLTSPLHRAQQTVALAALTPMAQAATPANTLVIAKQIDDLISLDPAEAYELSGIEVLANAYDRIMRFEPTDVTKLVPGVAEGVTVSDDGRTFTFKIRSGQSFASGNPVTAADAAFSLQRVIKLEKTPVFLLSQLGWSKDNIDAMVTAPDVTVRGPKVQWLPTTL